MQEVDDRLILEEFELRRRQKEAAAVIVSKLLGECFDRQNAFIADPSRNKAALCTRRAGKTEMWPRYSVKVALENSRCLIRIWAISRLRAKQLLWEPLKLLCARQQIKIKPNETELTIKFENGSEIRLLGADKDKEAQKKRGDKTILEIVLEAQMFGPYLQKLIEEVVEPCTMDLKGTICLEGTPGPILTGYWHAVSGNENVKSRWVSKGVTIKIKGESKLIGAGWSMHHWSVLNNPHLPHMREELADLKRKRNWTDDNPTYIREWLGRWVNDLGALFYAFDPVRNVFEHVVPYGHGWQHALGWDLGAKDDMALVVWAWHPKHRELFEAFSWKKPGASTEEVMKEIQDLESLGYNFVEKVADTQGGGKMYVDETMKRFPGQIFKPAKKGDKPAHVRLLNEDLREGFVKLRKGSEYAEEIAALARDLDWPPEDKPDELPREDPRCPNHCCDAGLYSYRAAWHYFHVEEKPKPKIGSEEWLAAEAKKLEDEDLNQSPPKDWWDVTEHADFDE